MGEHLYSKCDTDTDISDDSLDEECETRDIKPPIRNYNDDVSLEKPQQKRFPVKRPRIDGKYKCNFCDKRRIKYIKI